MVKRGKNFFVKRKTSNISFQLRRTWLCLKHVSDISYQVLPLSLPSYKSKCTVLFLRLFSSRCLILKSTQYKKAAELSISCGIKPSFQVIFHLICLFNRNEDVTKTNWWQKFGNFSGKRLKRSFFHCNFAIKIAHHRYFLEYVPKSSCLKNNILR